MYFKSSARKALRMRFPVAAQMALASAGANGRMSGTDKCPDEFPLFNIRIAVFSAQFADWSVDYR